MSVIVDSMYPDGGQPDFRTYFRTAWNANGFYFFGRAVDDSIDVTHANDWQRDNWEIYIDGDNSKGSSYDIPGDIQYRFIFGEDSATQGPGPSECDVAWVQTADGYTWELLIPDSILTDTNITLALDAIIGFEVQASDNDGGDRESITKWWSESNLSGIEPSCFGTAILTTTNNDKVEEEPLTISLSADAFNAEELSYTIPARSSVKVSVINVLGQVVDVPVSGVQSAGTYNAYIDEGIANGIYLIKLDACNQSVVEKSLMIK
jgi:hypothetical protein